MLIVIAVIVFGYIALRVVSLTVSMPRRVREFERRRADKKAKAAL